MAAKVMGFALSFALPLLIVRYMALDEVGHYREAFQVITNAVIILPLGFSMSVYYFLARETDNRGAAVLNILIFNFASGGLACLALFVYPQLVGNLFQSEELTRLAPKIGVVIWIWIFSTFLETVAIANQEMRIATGFIVLAQLTKTLMMGAAVMVFGTVEAFIYAAMVQGALQAFLLILYLRSRFPGFWRGFDPAFFKSQMIYAVPYGLAGVLWMAQNDIHNYFVGYKFSPSDYAIYAYGCFEVPLIAMLTESVTSVLIPRVTALQAVGNREEIIRLTAMAMQKLAFFYFPVYIFLLITAHTFIITLFTEKYEASASVFMINLTILPFSVFSSDPVVRSYKELGRIFLVTRIVILASLVTVLYFGLGHFDMIGMITTAVGAMVIEKCVAQVMVVRILGVSLHHLRLLKNVAKAAVLSIAAGGITYIAYSNAYQYLVDTGESWATIILSTPKPGTVHLVGGGLVMLVSGSIFSAIYLTGAYLWGVIDDGEKEWILKTFKRFSPKRAQTAIPEARG